MLGMIQWNAETRYFENIFTDVIMLYFRAREALRQCLPDQLRDTTFSQCLVEDTTTKHFLLQLLKNLETPAGNSVNAL